jgi:hypothetical protein
MTSNERAMDTMLRKIGEAASAFHEAIQAKNRRTAILNPNTALDDRIERCRDICNEHLFLCKAFAETEPGTDFLQHYLSVKGAIE